MRVHHIGYLVKKIEKAQAEFTKLGYETEAETVYDGLREIDICFMVKDGTRVELVAPKTETSVVTGLMGRYKNSPYHICYESDDFDGDVENLTKNGYAQIDEPMPAPALGGRRVVFLMNSFLGMIEILEA
ncbi:MAG: VOC family protein [Lachnospiraceae bacterium]|nr:VOC family protein [Lachnospiraceae bacterium]